MSTERKIDPEAGGRYLMKLLADDEAERLDRLSDEEFLAERKARGDDAWPTPSAEELIARVKARAAEQAQSASPGVAKTTNGARVVQATDATAPLSRLAPRSRTPRIVWLLAAAFVVAIVVAVTKGPAIVAFFRGDRVHYDIGPEPPAPPQELAARLRHDAIGFCEQGEWLTCRDKLDRAATLDPAGESDPQVQHLRTRIENAVHPPQQPKKDKPSP